jgi:adenosylmethionine-8-amino-7-oxononanoate aminotransferase
VAQAFADSSAPLATVTHGYTYSAHPVAAAAALASLDILERDQLVPKAAAQGSYFNERLADIARHSKLVGDVRGIGLMACLELVSDRATRAPLKGSAKETGLVAREAYKRGAMVRTSGPNIILSPALTIERSQIDLLCDALAGALKAVEG